MVSSWDILNSLSKRRAVHHACFEEILQTCFKRIERAALVSRLPFCVFEVPDFLMGYPVYDINECIRYLMNRIHASGFKIDYFFPNVLVITWHTPKDIESDARHNTHNMSLAANSGMYYGQQMGATGTAGTAGTATGISCVQHHTLEHIMPGMSLSNSRPIPDGPSELQMHHTYKNGTCTTTHNNTPQNTCQIRHIDELKPSGRFILNLT